MSWIDYTAMSTVQAELAHAGVAHYLVPSDWTYIHGRTQARRE